MACDFLEMVTLSGTRMFVLAVIENCGGRAVVHQTGLEHPSLSRPGAPRIPVSDGQSRTLRLLRELATCGKTCRQDWDQCCSP